MTDTKPAITRVRKAVFPAAGLGTRFLPATKAMPKEMLTLLDRPLIQHVVEEAMEAGIEQFIFVVSQGKTALEDHFDKQVELMRTLEARGKKIELKLVEDSTIPAGDFAFVRQPEPLGLGHAVWCARHAVGDEPFAVILPDEVVLGERSCLAQAMDIYNEIGGNVITVAEVAKEDTSKYGICALASDDGRVARISGFVEKPKAEEAPSNLSIHGRYIFQPRMFALLEEKRIGAGGEIQLTDAMARLVAEQPFHGVRVTGERYDCGNKQGFVLANVAFALRDPTVGPAVRQAIAQKLRQEMGG